MASHILTAEDRSIRVEPGKIVRTGYVQINDVILACRDRMAIGDVDAAYRRRLQLGPAQPWPCPVGEWQGDRFVVADGRHDVIAATMLGVEHILVAWVDTA